MNIIGRSSIKTSRFPGLKLRITPNQPKQNGKHTKRSLLKNTKKNNRNINKKILY
tara:strand:+ start:470 stop:634 length:165 start_codon:yes stop_codon:yes gene_type:complete